MNIHLDILLAGERAKIDLLRSKIRESEQRIATLQAMQGDDDLDAAIARRLQGVAVEPSPGAAAGNQKPLVEMIDGRDQAEVAVKKDAVAPKKALNATTLQLLRFSAGGDKSIDDFLAFADQHGITKDRQGMRAFLHQYKATYGLLTSDRAGYFRLSESGAAYLNPIDQPEGGAISAS